MKELAKKLIEVLGASNARELAALLDKVSASPPWPGPLENAVKNDDGYKNEVAIENDLKSTAIATFLKHTGSSFSVALEHAKSWHVDNPKYVIKICSDDVSWKIANRNTVNGLMRAFIRESKWKWADQIDQIILS